MIERVTSLSPAGAAGEFCSPVSAFCADSFCYPFHPLLPQWHVNNIVVPKVQAEGSNFQITLLKQMSDCKHVAFMPLCGKPPSSEGLGCTSTFHSCSVHTKL